MNFLFRKGDVPTSHHSIFDLGISTRFPNWREGEILWGDSFILSNLSSGKFKDCFPTHPHIVTKLLQERVVSLKHSHPGRGLLIRITLLEKYYKRTTNYLKGELFSLM